MSNPTPRRAVPKALRAFVRCVSKYDSEAW